MKINAWILLLAGRKKNSEHFHGTEACLLSMSAVFLIAIILKNYQIQPIWRKKKFHKKTLTSLLTANTDFGSVDHARPDSFLLSMTWPEDWTTCSRLRQYYLTFPKPSTVSPTNGYYSSWSAMGYGRTSSAGKTTSCLPELKRSSKAQSHHPLQLHQVSLKSQSWVHSYSWPI